MSASKILHNWVCRRPAKYRPLQLPHILDKTFSMHVAYSEATIESLQDFVICLWEIKPVSSEKISLKNIVLADGCIDLVVTYDTKKIGYVGMGKPYFNSPIHLPARIFGARLKPGAFEQLTKIPAKMAMGKFLKLELIDADFDSSVFFSLEYEQAKEYFAAYLQQRIGTHRPNSFVTLFDRLCENPPSHPTALYELFQFNPRQCQRYFIKHFGFSPQMLLSILRFQYCLNILTFGKATPSDVLELAAFYDQSHFIKDFKRNIGITPFEYFREFTQ